MHIHMYVHNHRYEMLLREHLQSLGIVYQSEDDLRAAGFSKTPDVKLVAPIGVCGRMVNWIDSKASFGDEHSHKMQASDQFQRYWKAHLSHGVLKLTVKFLDV